MFINGDILEERMLPLSKNSKINSYGGILYNLSFDAEEYIKIYDKANKLYKIKKKNNKIHNEVFLNKYDVLMNILNRKGNKDIILRYLYKIILNNEEKSFYIVKFLIIIIEKINIALQKNIIPNKKIIQKEIIESNNAVNLPKIFDIIMTKKNYIKQIDILINIFGKLEQDIEKNKNTQNDFILRVIFYMIQFAFGLNDKKIIIQPCFHKILLSFIKKLKNKEKIFEYFLNYNIFDHFEIGEYFLKLSKNKNDNYCKLYECIGINILKRIKKYEIVVDYYFEQKQIAEGLNYLGEISNEITESQLINIININKNNICKFKKYISEYI